MADSLSLATWFLVAGSRRTLSRVHRLAFINISAAAIVIGGRDIGSESKTESRV